MGKKTANKWLYVVGFFSLVTLVCALLTVKIAWPLFMSDSTFLAASIFFTILQVLLILAPFLKDNRFLFLMIIIAYMSSYSTSVVAFWGYLFLTGYDLAKVGIVPGWLSMGGFVFLDTIGLAVLILRCYGYLKEHRAGLKTQF